MKWHILLWGGGTSSPCDSFQIQGENKFVMQKTFLMQPEVEKGETNRQIKRRLKSWSDRMTSADKNTIEWDVLTYFYQKCI